MVEGFMMGRAFVFMCESVTSRLVDVVVESHRLCLASVRNANGELHWLGFELAATSGLCRQRRRVVSV